MKKIKIIITGCIIFFVIVFVLVIIFWKKFVNTIYGITGIGYRHMISCDNLPSFSEAQEILLTHQDKADAISNTGVIMSIDKTCFNKGQINIYFDNKQEMDNVKDIIGGEDFYGVPYNMYNVQQN